MTSTEGRLRDSGWGRALQAMATDTGEDLVVRGRHFIGAALQSFIAWSDSGIKRERAEDLVDALETLRDALEVENRELASALESHAEASLMAELEVDIGDVDKAEAMQEVAAAVDGAATARDVYCGIASESFCPSELFDHAVVQEFY